MTTSVLFNTNYSMQSTNPIPLALCTDDLTIYIDWCCFAIVQLFECYPTKTDKSYEHLTQNRDITVMW